MPAKLAPTSRAFVVLLGALTALTALSIDMSLPALPRLASVFATTPDKAQLTLSVFLIGFAIGQLAYGPISDRFGRRPVLIFGLVVYTLAGIGCALAGSIDQLILCRFLQGAGGCVGRVMGPAIVRDEFHAQHGAQVLSYVTLVMALAPLIAPVIGGYLLVIADWQAIFLVLAGFGAIVLAVIAARFGESSKHRDAQATQIPTLLRNYGRFLANRACLGYALINCFVFAGLFSYISGSSFVFIEVFGLPSHVYGMLFGATALAFMSGAALNGRLVRKRAPQAVLRAGLAIVLLAGAVMLGVALAAPSVLGVMLAIMIYVFGMSFVFPNATAAAMEPMPRMAGVASSLLGSSQMATGSLVGYLVNRFYDRTPLAMATGIAAAALLACLTHALLIRRAGAAPGKAAPPSPPPAR
jgi:DHA1 family bicyclomycin/chloramphenicol resistance-like MFS transporter